MHSTQPICKWEALFGSGDNSRAIEPSKGISALFSVDVNDPSSSSWPKPLSSERDSELAQGWSPDIDDDSTNTQHEQVEQKEPIEQEKPSEEEKREEGKEVKDSKHVELNHNVLDNLKPIRVKDLPTDSRQQFNEALRRVEDWKSKAPKDSLEKWDGHVDWMKATCNDELKDLPKEDKQWWCEVWASMEWFQYPENDQDENDEDAVQQEEEGFQQEPDIQQESDSLQQEWQQQDHQGQWDQEDIEAQWAQFNAVGRSSIPGVSRHMG